jgi:hypothetical protein
MELDPGIHIAMHSVLFLKPGVTAVKFISPVAILNVGFNGMRTDVPSPSGAQSPQLGSTCSVGTHRPHVMT